VTRRFLSGLKAGVSTPAIPMTGTPGDVDPHFHKTFSESFCVMEGMIRLFN
jgi:hypothetical protein